MRFKTVFNFPVFIPPAKVIQGWAGLKIKYKVGNG